MWGPKGLKIRFISFFSVQFKYVTITSYRGRLSLMNWPKDFYFFFFLLLEQKFYLPSMYNIPGGLKEYRKMDMKKVTHVFIIEPWRSYIGILECVNHYFNLLLDMESAKKVWFFMGVNPKGFIRFTRKKIVDLKSWYNFLKWKTVWSTPNGLFLFLLRPL